MLILSHFDRDKLFKWLCPFDMTQITFFFLLPPPPFLWPLCFVIHQDILDWSINLLTQIQSRLCLQGVLFLFIEKEFRDHGLGVGGTYLCFWGLFSVRIRKHLLIYFFFGCTCGMWKFLGQESNLHDGWSNAGFLTCCATRELPRSVYFWKKFTLLFLMIMNTTGF